jgi:hypothetical protein
VLFDGRDLSKWVQRSRAGAVSDAQWAVHDGIFESGPGGSISTRENFGHVQVHIEYDAANMKVTNLESANKLFHYEDRQGWSL